MTASDQSGGRLRVVAIGLAIAALGLAAIAAFVALSRGDGHAVADPIAAGSSTKPVDDPPPTERRVAATDIVRLKRDSVTTVLEHGTSIGLRVTDLDLRDKLGLGDDDVVVAFSGRTLRRDWDMLDAVSGVVMLDAKTIYVEILHAGAPQLLRWRIDGDLKTARRAAIDPPTRLPSVAPVADPIVATIEKTDDTHYAMPRDTSDKVTSDPGTYTKGVRGYASFGGSEGFRVYAIRPGTLMAAIGIQNTDTVRTVNGETVTSIDQFNTRIGTLKSATKWTIELERRGTAMTLEILVK